MDKGRMIKVVDKNKWALKMFAGLGVLLVVVIIMLSIIEDSEGSNTSMILIILFLIVAMLGYGVYSYKSSTKYVSAKEYCEINKNVTDAVLIQQLRKQAFSDEEINEILKDRLVTKNVGNQNRKLASRENLLDNQNETLKGGSSVHHHTFWDSFQWRLYATLIITILIAIIYGNAGVVVYVIVPVSILVFSVYFFLTAIDILPNRTNLAIKFNCPHCNNSMWVEFPEQQMICPYCKKTIGYYRDKIYMVTKENEHYFQNELQKTNALLQKQFASNNKVASNDTSVNNFSQIKELKELLDMGAISQEEYDAKKKDLLK